METVKRMFKIELLITFLIIGIIGELVLIIKKYLSKNKKLSSKDLDTKKTNVTKEEL